MSEKTSLGISENLEGALAYLLGPITGFLFLILERENKFVRFHSLQAFITTLVLIVAKSILGMLPLIGNPLSSAISFIYFIAVICLILNAYAGKKFKVPFIGDIVHKQVYGI